MQRCKPDSETAKAPLAQLFSQKFRPRSHQALSAPTTAPVRSLRPVGLRGQKWYESHKDSKRGNRGGPQYDLSW